MKYRVRVGSGAALHWVEVDADNEEQAKKEATKQGGKAYSAELMPFNPYTCILRHGGVADKSGINWSFAKFTNRDQRNAFIKECNDNGYRTRSVYDELDGYFVQYHHYVD